MQVGRRLTKVSMLSGSIVRVWGALEGVLVRSESILSKSDRTMRIVRVNIGEATSLIGRLHLKPCSFGTIRCQHDSEASVAVHIRRKLTWTHAHQADQGCLSAVSGLILLCSPCLKDTVNHAGVRYPPQLLDDVVAVLASAQAAIPQLTAGGPAADQAGSLGGGQLGSSALHASAMGAAMAVRMEPVISVDPKSVAKAFRYGSCFALEPLRCRDRLGECIDLVLAADRGLHVGLLPHPQGRHAHLP